MNDNNWSEIIACAQRNDNELMEAMREQPTKYYKRNGIVRTMSDNARERIEVPESVAWEIVDKIHNTDITFWHGQVYRIRKEIFSN